MTICMYTLFLAMKTDDWKSDQIRWKTDAVHLLPKKNPVLRKRYYILDTENGPSKDFKKHVYQLLDSKHITIIHYIGDHSAISKFPHRNSKKGSTAFVRTCPSTFNKLAKVCKTNKASVVYKKEVAEANCLSEQVPTHMPRDLKQLQNLRFKHLSHSRISRDDLYNLHEIAYDTKGFVHKIITYPDLACVCGLDQILKETNQILQLNETGQLLSYDTTFQLGDFYVSALLLRHTIFEEKPCIPVMFLIHERKFAETHQILFQEAVRHIPSIKSTSSCLVIDREKAIIKAAEMEVPNLHQLQCWNHIYRDIRFWLRKHGAPNTDITVYIDDISNMFHSASEDEYNERLVHYSKTWDPLFEQYFTKEIHPIVPRKVGRWLLESYQLYNPYCGVTNNQAEGFNKVMKDFQQWKEAPLDSFVLALYQLQAFYFNEIQRGLAGMY